MNQSTNTESASLIQLSSGIRKTITYVYRSVVLIAGWLQRVFFIATIIGLTIFYNLGEDGLRDFQRYSMQETQNLVSSVFIIAVMLSVIISLLNAVFFRKITSRAGTSSG